MWLILLALVLVVPFFFAWAAIHEYSHYLAAKMLVGATLDEMSLIPSRKLGRFTFAYVKYTPAKNPNTAQRFLISWAPRLPGLLAILGFLFVPQILAFNAIVGTIAFMFFGAGIVDYVNGLIGRSPSADLYRAAAAIQLPAWNLRILTALPLSGVLVTLLTLIIGLL